MTSPKPVPPPVTRMRLPRSSPSLNINSMARSSTCPPAVQAGDDVLQPRAVLPIHLQAFQRVNLIELPQEFAFDLVGNHAFDKSDEYKPLSGSDRSHFVQGG